MGRKRKGRYIIEWWLSDHPPRHVHVYDARGEFLGRLVIEPPLRGMGGWRPARDVVRIVSEMIAKGEL